MIQKEKKKMTQVEIQKNKDGFIIAIDKGADHLHKIGLKGDMLLGDLDSMNESLKDIYKDKILKLPVVKDDTDTAVALDYAIENGGDDIIIYAALGARFDHTYANLLLLKRALDKNVRCRLVDEQNIVELHKKSFDIENMNNKTVSFFSFDNPINITLKGFYYTLDNYCLERFDPLGVSNVVTCDKASVKFDEGVLLSVIARDK